ncbi:MAG: S8 family serine peptidase [Legionellaceae bacterium]|nr:S8 family serine peptidase [Legionellaceae bacterium]
MKKLMLIVLLFVSNPSIPSVLDDNIITALHSLKTSHNRLHTTQINALSIIVFAISADEMSSIEHRLKKITSIKYQRLGFMPAFLISIQPNEALLREVSQFSGVARLSLKPTGKEESQVTSQSILLEPSADYPNISNWYAHGYSGENQTVGLLDSGIAREHMGLRGKTIHIRQEPGSFYDHYIHGVRTAHGTGIACIYAGIGSPLFEQEKGIASQAETIEMALAGDFASESSDELGMFLTFNSLDWLLHRAPKKPDIINYSFGHGASTCPDCPDWSGISKIVDYVINKQHILWVKSAGNQGWGEPSYQAPYTSKLTIPADNYNGLTVANMNYALGLLVQNTPSRFFHQIMNSSSRGPTKIGRKKPDIAAPGNKTRTCAPDPSVYNYIHYSSLMDYQHGYRLMGGTSSATPHVGASVLLLKSAGIIDPKAIKALLINSADAWDDGAVPVADPDKQEITHHQVDGSMWNPTYGWGYLNMDKAFHERNNLLSLSLSSTKPTLSFEVYLPVGGKVTLVHERRVGHEKDGREWSLTPLELKLHDKNTHQLIDIDKSKIDSVHQVANCHRTQDVMHCNRDDLDRWVTITVSLNSDHIDGADEETFSLAYSAQVNTHI